VLRLRGWGLADPPDWADVLTLFDTQTGEYMATWVPRDSLARCPRVAEFAFHEMERHLWLRGAAQPFYDAVR